MPLTLELLEEKLREHQEAETRHMELSKQHYDLANANHGAVELLKSLIADMQNPQDASHK